MQKGFLENSLHIQCFRSPSAVSSETHVHRRIASHLEFSFESQPLGQTSRGVWIVLCFFFFLFRCLFLSFFLSLLPPLRPHTFEFTQWNPCVTCSHPSEYCRPTGWLRNTGLVLLTVPKSRSPRSGASKVPLPRRGRPTCPCFCITGGRQELRGVHVIEGLISSRGPILAASSPSQKPQLLTPSH